MKESVMVLLGRDPVRPKKDELPEDVRQLHAKKRNDRERIDAIQVEMAHRAKGRAPEKLRRKRWIVRLFVNLLFLVSYYLAIHLLEGALTGSRFVGFHMADVNSALQVMLAFKHVVLNLTIGTITVLVSW